jgi:TetR/AcrR family transcriptional regulator, transcriptional repressor of bet genes
MGRQRQPEEVRREQILQAAFDVASRDGIGGLTVRAVAAEAGISHALVLFHFGRKERLVHELLDWVIGGTAVLHISDDIAQFPHARDRLHALLQQEMARLSHQPEQTRLFLEFWAMGAREEQIRTQISAELERYRSAFRAIMEELLLAEPDHLRGRDSGRPGRRGRELDPWLRGAGDGGPRALRYRRVPDGRARHDRAARLRLVDLALSRPLWNAGSIGDVLAIMAHPEAARRPLRRGKSSTRGMFRADHGGSAVAQAVDPPRRRAQLAERGRSTVAATENTPSSHPDCREWSIFAGPDNIAELPGPRAKLA